MTDMALVRSAGQIDIVFTLLFSRFYLHERLQHGDIAGLGPVTGSVLLIVLAQ